MENQKGEKGTFLSDRVQFINFNAISALKGSNKSVDPSNVVLLTGNQDQCGSNEIFHLWQTLITML